MDDVQHDRETSPIMYAVHVDGQLQARHIGVHYCRRALDNRFQVTTITDVVRVPAPGSAEPSGSPMRGCAIVAMTQDTARPSSAGRGVVHDVP